MDATQSRRKRYRAVHAVNRGSLPPRVHLNARAWPSSAGPGRTCGHCDPHRHVIMKYRYMEYRTNTCQQGDVCGKVSEWVSGEHEAVGNGDPLLKEVRILAPRLLLLDSRLFCLIILEQRVYIVGLLDVVL